MPKEYRSDKRLVSQRRKRELIWNAMNTMLKDKPLGEISIQMICDLAGVHRTTFYNHFYDVYDLIGYGTELIVQNAVAGIEFKNDSPKDEFEEILFTFVCKNRTIIMDIQDSVYQSGILGALQKVIEKQLEKKGSHDGSMTAVEGRAEMHKRFVSYGFAGLVFSWIRNGEMDDDRLKEEIHIAVSDFAREYISVETAD